ncbi:MAG: hypothetical protein ACW96S_07050 [Promethearchaeota archaeon]|jgi:hypothetical protein
MKTLNATIIVVIATINDAIANPKTLLENGVSPLIYFSVETGVGSTTGAGVLGGGSGVNSEIGSGVSATSSISLI